MPNSPAIVVSTPVNGVPVVCSADSPGDPCQLWTKSPPGPNRHKGNLFISECSRSIVRIP